VSKDNTGLVVLALGGGVAYLLWRDGKLPGTLRALPQVITAPASTPQAILDALADAIGVPAPVGPTTVSASQPSPTAPPAAPVGFAIPGNDEGFTFTDGPDDEPAWSIGVDPTQEVYGAHEVGDTGIYVTDTGQVVQGTGVWV